MQPEEKRSATPWERLALPLTGVTAGAFGALAALRRNRVFHPVGEAFSGTLTFVEADAPAWLPWEPGVPLEVVVRFSRGAGVPEPVPDVLGLAVKVRAGDLPEHDFLLATSGTSRGARHVLLPARSFLSAMFSSVLPYRVADRQLVFGARAAREVRGDGRGFGELRSLVAAGRLRFDLLVAGLGDDWARFGVLSVDGACPQEISRDLRFNPWNCVPEIRPAGALNVLRRRAYASSQAARPA